eukprot:gene6887-7663_t
MARLKATAMEKLHAFDVDLSEWLSICADVSNGDYTKRYLRVFLKFLEMSGHGIPWLFFSSYFAYRYSGELADFSCNIFLAMIFDLVVVGLLKVLIRRKRPVYNADDMIATVKIDDFSFPSGHTTRGILLAVIFENHLSNKVHVAMIHGWAFVLALSRIVLGRHHISDVIAGILIGVLEAFIVLNYLWTDKKFVEHVVFTTSQALRFNNMF